jgi:hypothetical protein
VAGRAQAQVLPNRFMVTSEAAAFLSMSPRTLEKHRVSGTGPIYRKLGGEWYMQWQISRRGLILD